MPGTKRVERSQDGMLTNTLAQYLTKADGRSFTYDAELGMGTGKKE